VEALYGIGQAEELSGNLPSAEDSYRAAILLIETTRTQLQLAALRAEFLADKRDVYDALIALLVKKNDVKGAFSFLERSRARTFQDRLLSTTAGREATRYPDLDEIRRYLSSSTILLEFWVSGDHLALIWCTRESFGIEQLQLSPAERDNALSFVRELPESLQSNWRERTAVLTRLISAGLASPKLRHVLIVPDGWLSSMPFDLVPSGSSSGELLIERFDITYLPTAALLRRPISRDKGFRFPWMRELVAFGNPVVQPQAAPLQNPDASSGLQPLPYSEVEIQNISKMTRGKADLFLGPSDLKSSFIASITQSTPIVHVSTHAFADAEVPENSRMLFSPETSNGVADYVFLRELYDLDLHDVDLATLSACNTEQGKLIRGEGVQAFSRALLSAGSRSTLTTLWRVSDQPTSEFMQQFYYFALKDRQSKAEALRSAKLKFLRSKKEFEHPAQWAGFVLSGDGLSDLPTFVSWRVLAIWAVIAISLLASGFSLALRFGRRNHRVNRS
jgi:Uncharacterized protein conserved in bacteria